MPEEDVEAERAPAALQLEAEHELDQLGEVWRQRVLEEADRLMAARDDGTGREPITPGDIRRAAHYVDGMPAPARISRLEIVYQVVSYLAAIIAGYFSNNLDKTWGSIGFVVIVIMGATAILLTLQERRKGRW